MLSWLRRLRGARNDGPSTPTQTEPGDVDAPILYTGGAEDDAGERNGETESTSGGRKPKKVLKKIGRPPKTNWGPSMKDFSDQVLSFALASHFALRGSLRPYRTHSPAIEGSILLFLYRNRGIQPRARICSWAECNSTNANTLRVHIWNLRQALGYDAFEVNPDPDVGGYGLTLNGRRRVETALLEIKSELDDAFDVRDPPKPAVVYGRAR